MKITASTTLAELAILLASRGLRVSAEIPLSAHHGVDGRCFEVTLSNRHGYNWVGRAQLLQDALYSALKQHDTQLAKSVRSS